MNIRFFLIIVLLGWHSISFAQSPEPEKSKTGIYTGFVNIAPPFARYPLIGLVNIGRGDQKNPQIGLINWNVGQLKGVQIGLVNGTGNQVRGAQVGLVNTAANQAHGIQLGLINTSPKGNLGPQVGLINVTKRITGTQIGLINFADSVDKSVPIGLISIVKKGGYRSLSVEFTEHAPLNVAFRLGVKSLYTVFMGSYWEGAEHPWSLGTGLGSIISLGNQFAVNPEVIFHQHFQDNQSNLAFSPYLLWNLTPQIALSAAPVWQWRYLNDGEGPSDFYFTFADWTPRNQTRTGLGLRAGLRVHL